METILHIPIQNDILLSLNQNTKEFGAELKVWAAISMYYFRKISLARASTLAGMHRYDFEKHLAKYKIPNNLLDAEDANKEIELIDQM